MKDQFGVSFKTNNGICIDCAGCNDEGVPNTYTWQECYGRNKYYKDELTLCPLKILPAYKGHNEGYKEEILSTGICKNCGEKCSTVKRSFPGIILTQIICDKCKSRETLEKEIVHLYNIGDKIRYYSSTFEKESKLILDTYVEGTVVDVRDGITDQELDLLVDNDVVAGQKIPETGWVYGSIIHGIRTRENLILLLSRNPIQNNQ